MNIAPNIDPAIRRCYEKVVYSRNHRSYSTGTPKINDMETSNSNYAGFGARFLAALIDGILLGFVNMVIMTPVLGKSAEMFIQAEQGIDMENFDYAGLFTQWAMSYLAIIAVAWLYHSIMESSSMQATLGKRLLGIRVVDMQGERISFLRATGRFFGKFLSSLILAIGYLMAAFTERRQALHDMLAGTLVWKN